MFNLSKTPKAIRASASANPSMKIVAVEGDKPELYIMDVIGKDFWGDGISASEVSAFLKRHKNEDVDVLFNSEGGNVYEGLVIHNAFEEHGNVTAIVEGLAYSAAAFAAVGAKKVAMKKQSDFGIHRAWTGTVGNLNAMKAAHDWLAIIDEHQIDIFSNKTGATKEQVTEWIEGVNDGTVFTAEKAYEVGFADEIIGVETQPPTKASAIAHDRIAASMRHRKAMARFRV